MNIFLVISGGHMADVGNTQPSHTGKIYIGNILFFIEYRIFTDFWTKQILFFAEPEKKQNLFCQ